MHMYGHIVCGFDAKSQSACYFLTLKYVLDFNDVG